jgi:hypothetical protein
VPLHLRPLLPLQSVSLARQKAYHGTVGTRPNRNDGKDGMTVRQKGWQTKYSNNIIQKTQHIKHDTEMHLTSAMNAWPSEQRCMGWTQWAAHEDRHLVPSLELTQEETGCEKSLVTINKYLLQTSVKFSNKAEQGGGYGRLEICWTMVCPSLFATARPNNSFHDSLRADAHTFPWREETFSYTVATFCLALCMALGMLCLSRQPLSISLCFSSWCLLFRNCFANVLHVCFIDLYRAFYLCFKL